MQHKAKVIFQVKTRASLRKNFLEWPNNILQDFLIQVLLLDRQPDQAASLRLRIFVNFKPGLIGSHPIDSSGGEDQDCKAPVGKLR